MNRRLIQFMLGLFFMVFGFSCKTAGPVANVANDIKNEEGLLALLKANEFQYETLTGKANITIEQGDKKSSIKASIRIRKDSAIWIHFSYIGFAGARVLISEDSVKIINYKDENFILTDIDYINEKLNIDVDFETLQSLLIGNSTPFDEDEKLRTSVDDDNYYMSSMRKRKIRRGIPEKRLEKLERKQEKNPERQRYVKKQERKEEKYSEDAYSIWLNKHNNKIVKTRVVDFLNEMILNAYYSDFQKTGDQLFPYMIDMDLSAKGQSKIKINYSKVVKDKEVKFSFSIPSKYEQIYK